MGEKNSVEVKAMDCQHFAQKLRKRMLDMATIGGQYPMHWGGAMSSVEILSVLFKEIINHGDWDIGGDGEDKFILSKGHAAFGYYVVLNAIGKLPDDVLNTYHSDGTHLAELLEANDNLGFTASCGSLGLGLSYGAGLALRAKKKDLGYRVFVEVGDGELDEGAIWEAIMFASQNELNNLYMIIDLNMMQSDGATKDIIKWDDLDKKLSSFGWETVSVDGHNCKDLLLGFNKLSGGTKPKAMIANTVKGKGISFMENNNLWHDRMLRGDELEQARKEVEKYA